MGRRVRTDRSAPTSAVKSVLSVALGIVLSVVGVATVLTFVGMLLFGGLELFEEVGHTGDATGAAVLGLAVVGGMIATGGFSLVSPALARLSDRYRRFTPAAYARERLVMVCVAAVLVLASCVLFFVPWATALMLGSGVAQLALAVYALVRLRATARGLRWPNVVVAVVSSLVNPVTLLTIVAIGYAVSGRSFT